ncbi:RidA family protein [Pseudarthrobacter oxydans]|uniref:RidA family protein n=1 Tax=Pseudarthrobacter oxydans TaxID=1671 RepID=UPI00380A9D4E
MTILKLNPEQMSTHTSPFSHIVCHEKSSLAFLSGQTAVDRDGTLVGEGDAARQTEQVFKNIEAALESLGESWASVISLTTYLTSYEHMQAFRETRARLFDSYFPDGGHPAHTLLVVAGLGSPQHLIEVEAVVAHSLTGSSGVNVAEEPG